jgi:predicted DCC family thiol-disulfide oxidoreductase YuxK
MTATMLLFSMYLMARTTSTAAFSAVVPTRVVFHRTASTLRRPPACAQSLLSIAARVNDGATNAATVTLSRTSNLMLSMSTAASPPVEDAVFSNTPDSSVMETTPLVLDGPVILFDGVCNFCNTWVDLLLRIDVKQRFRFAPLQSTLGQRLLQAVGKDANDISSVMLVQPDLVTYYDKSACVLQVVAELGPVARVLSSAARRIVPPRFRDSIYDVVAENRYNLMGKRNECRCSDPKYAHRFLS